MPEVIARATRPPRWMWTNLVIQAALAGLWTWRFLQDGETVAGGLAAGFVLLALLGGVLIASTPPAALVLTDEALLVQRRWRPRRVARSSVRAVHGNVPGRPTWSESVVIETDSGPVHLGGLDLGVPAMIDRLQAWARVGEQPAGT